MILVVDYGRGNLFSIGQALRHVGAEYEVSGDPARLRDASKIVFPGVGAFGDAMDSLRERGLVGPIKDAAAAGVPILGICVGCQLLLSRGEEFGDHEGLGIIPGTVSRLREPAEDGPDVTRVPNVGWRRVDADPEDPVLGALGPEDMVYFVHSYAPMASEPEHIVARIMVNGVSVPAAVRRQRVLGVQFHPEKSGPVGLNLLRRFVETEFAN